MEGFYKLEAEPARSVAHNQPHEGAGPTLLPALVIKPPAVATAPITEQEKAKGIDLLKKLQAVSDMWPKDLMATPPVIQCEHSGTRIQSGILLAPQILIGRRRRRQRFLELPVGPGASSGATVCGTQVLWYSKSG